MRKESSENGSIRQERDSRKRDDPVSTTRYVVNPLRGTMWLPPGIEPGEIEWADATPAGIAQPRAQQPARAPDRKQMARQRNAPRSYRRRSRRTHSELAHTSVAKDGR